MDSGAAGERDLVRTLVYKRTHKGDPDKRGWFGIEDCMKRVRGYEFDAVIGVGGVSRQPRHQGIAKKINWIGLGARKKSYRDRKGPVVTFDHFRLYEERGKKLREKARTLARHIYSRNVRVLLKFTPAEEKEVQQILRMARSAPPSARVMRLPRLRKRARCGCDYCPPTKKKT